MKYDIAKKENCQAAMAGESLGQVGFQTLSNLGLIQEAKIENY
ncbi:MAG: hypothetical protein KY055_01590 [Candidatus Nealsonbacteria bacterium]|nr:hypothetical protein [Candidatus Nealsonbacteria bacterium]